MTKTEFNQIEKSILSKKGKRVKNVNLHHKNGSVWQVNLDYLLRVKEKYQIRGINFVYTLDDFVKITHGRTILWAA